MDIIEIDGEPVAKRGKRSGSKSVSRCQDCLETTVLPAGQRPALCKCGGKKEEILKPTLSKGETKTALAEPENIRSFVINQLEKVDL